MRLWNFRSQTSLWRTPSWIERGPHSTPPPSNAIEAGLARRTPPCCIFSPHCTPPSSSKCGSMRGCRSLKPGSTLSSRSHAFDMAARIVDRACSLLRRADDALAAQPRSHCPRPPRCQPATATGPFQPSCPTCITFGVLGRGVIPGYSQRRVFCLLATAKVRAASGGPLSSFRVV